MVKHQQQKQQDNNDDDDVLNLNSVSINTGILDNKDLNDFNFNDTLALSAANNLKKLIDENKLTKKTFTLNKELEKLSKDKFEQSLPDKIDIVKKKIKPITEKVIAPTKEKTKQEKREEKVWGKFCSKGVSDNMKLEAELIHLQQFADPSKRASRAALSQTSLPDKFEIGTIVDQPTDYYYRFTNKEKRRGAFGDIMANEKSLDYITTKSNKILTEDRRKSRYTNKRQKTKP
eukprot:gene559-704_t